MKRKLLTDQMVESIDDPNGYYKVNVLLSLDNNLEGDASIPELGRLTVVREELPYQQGFSMVWKVKEKFLFTTKEDTLFLARRDLPHVMNTCYKEKETAIKQAQFQSVFFQQKRYVYHYKQWHIVITDHQLETWFESKKENILWRSE
jgi:hypothetical protein